MEANMIQHLMKGIDPSRTSSIQLRQGQIFQGAITQIYPGGSAQLQLGQMNLTAHLEAQLEKGKSYWFRVASSEGLPRLQVMENVAAPNHQNMGSQMLQQLGLPKGAAQEKLIQHLTQQSVPFTKQNFAQASQVMQQSPLAEKETLQLLSSMMHRQLPVTRDSFQALASLQTNQPLAETMNQLASELRSMPQSKPVAQLQQVLTQMLANAVPEESGSRLNALMQLAASGSESAKSQTGQLLQQLGITASSDVKEIRSHFRQEVMRPENSPIVRQLFPGAFTNTASGPSLQQLTNQQFFNYMSQQLRLDTPQANQQLMQLLGTREPDAAQQSLNQFVREVPPAGMKEVWNAMQQLSTSSHMSSRDASPEHPLRTFLQQLGMQHESSVKQMMQQDLLLQGKNVQQETNLKAELMNLLQTQQLSASAREQAEFLIHRITGYQMTSQEQQGPLQHLLIQVPVAMFQKYQDVTIQWSGSETKDGQMNEDHCRILFYLHLDSLKEVVVDVQIQNRIVTVNIFNESPKPFSVAAVWGPMLKEKMEEMNYQLSGINWKQPEKIASQQMKAASEYEMPRTYKGVDFRV